MQYRQVPQTDVRVSALCLGTMTLGNPVAKDDAVRLIHWALDSGVNFIDTADIYEGYDRYLGSPGGVAESILGDALQGRREQAVITTKVGNAVGGDYEGAGLGRDHVLHQVNASLRRLRTDYVDFYELHRPDPDTPLAESIAVMAELIDAGKVRHWGFSNFDAPRIDEMVRACDANGWPRPVISQPFYNWLHREAETDHIDACQRHDIGVTPYQVLQGGLLTGKYGRNAAPPAGTRAAEHPQWLEIKPDVFEKLDELERESAAAGLEPVQYAIRWLLDRPAVTAVVVGAKRIEQIEELLCVCE
jgi:aryl-alcohol dehydrogenase-like predicted oxidoreductase